MIVSTDDVWQNVLGHRPGDYLIFKTLYGFVRIERGATSDGFATFGAIEDMFSNLDDAVAAAVRELAMREQEQRG